VTRGGTGPRLRQLAGHSFVYGLGGLVSKLVGIFLLPIYTHRVSKAQFGEVEQIMAAVAVAAVVLRLGLTTAMFRFCWDHREPDARRRTIRTAFTATLGLSTAGLVLGLILLGPLADVLNSSRELTLIGVFGLWVSMNFDILAGIYRIEQRPTAFVAYSLLNVAITIVLSIVLVLPLHMGAAGVMLGNFSGTYITYGLLLVARRRTIGLMWDRDLLRRMLDFSLPLVPAGVALWALNLADRFQVINLASPSQLGSYSAASKIALGIMLPIAAFQTAWVPFANAFTDEAEAKRTYRVVFVYWSMLMAWGVVAISVVTPPYVHLLMPRTWWGSAPVVPLLAGGSALYGAYLILSIGVNRSKRTKLTPLVTGTAAAVNIGLNFLFIPRWGIVGAGASTVIGYVVLAALGFANSQQGYPVRHDWPRVARVVAVACAFVAASIAIVPAAGLVGLPVRLAMLLAFPLALVAVGALSPDDRRRIADTVAQMRRPRRGARAAEAEELAVEQTSAEEDAVPAARPGVL
jgi:O-antigen/teichoic acid export membrane protein